MFDHLKVGKSYYYSNEKYHYVIFLRDNKQEFVLLHSELCYKRIIFVMELNFKSYGQGSAIIILHGLFGSLDNWATHARSLAESYSVYILDQRNHGKSPHDEGFSYELMAEDLAEFMDNEGIYQAHILGHSMGGKTAMKFAAEYPDRIDKLIVADMAPKAYPPHHTEILAALIEMDLSQMQSRQDAAKYMEARIPELSVRQFLLKSLGRAEDKSFKWKFNLPVIYDNYTEILAEVQLDFPFERETLFLSGGNSPYVTPTDHQMILDQFPQAKFQVLPNAGHWIHAEAPEAFMEAVWGFFST